MKVDINCDMGEAYSIYTCGDDAAIKDLVAYNGANMAKDRDGNLVFMARSAWDIGYQQERHPKVKLSATRER